MTNAKHASDHNNWIYVGTYPLEVDEEEDGHTPDPEEVKAKAATYSPYDDRIDDNNRDTECLRERVKTWFRGFRNKHFAAHEAIANAQV